MALPDWIHSHLTANDPSASKPLSPASLDNYPCDTDGQTPVSGTYRLDGGVSVRDFTCPNGHHYSDHNDGG